MILDSRCWNMIVPDVHVNEIYLWSSLAIGTDQSTELETRIVSPIASTQPYILWIWNT